MKWLEGGHVQERLFPEYNTGEDCTDGFTDILFNPMCSNRYGSPHNDRLRFLACSLLMLVVGVPAAFPNY